MNVNRRAVKTTTEPVEKTQPDLELTVPVQAVTGPESTDLFEVILKFLESPGSVLLIQGNPGTGKTTMALEILRNSRASRKTYASSRTSPTKLRQHFPFIDEVLDLMSGRVARSNYLAEFQDLRQDSDSLFNKVLRLKHTKEPALMVVDSWEGALRNTTDEGRSMLESAILSELEDSKLSVALVAEGQRIGDLSHLVDGIVTLSASEIEGRVTRTFTVNKLRGRRIPINRALFSLEGSRFSQLPFEDSLDGISANPKRLISHSDSHYSTGSNNLDHAIRGGVKRGSIVLVDVDPGVAPGRVRMLLNSIYANFLNQGGSCFSVPFGNYSAEAVVESLKDFIPLQVLNDRVRIAAYNVQGPPKKMIVPFRGRIQEDAEMFVRTWNSLDGKSPKMLVIDYDKLLSIYGDNETFSGMAGISEAVRDSGAMNIGLTTRHTRLREEMVRAADYHLKLKSQDGWTLLFGVKPYTPIFGIKFELGSGPPTLILTPMV